MLLLIGLQVVFKLVAYFIFMSSFNDLYGIQKQNLQDAVTVLSNAFSEDSMWKEVFDDEEKNRILTEVMVRYCLTYGNVVSTSDKLEGIMAIAPYGKDMTFFRIIRSGAFFLSMKIGSESKKFKIKRFKIFHSLRGGKCFRGHRQRAAFHITAVLVQPFGAEGRVCGRGRCLPPGKPLLNLRWCGVFHRWREGSDVSVRDTGGS